MRGIDFSPAYIEHAKRNNHDSRIAFEVGDACVLGFPGHRFDRVVSLLMLHFVPSPEQAIAEMRRVARPGAVVGTAVWDARGGFVANKLFFDTAGMLDPQASDRRARSYTRPMTRPGELHKARLAAGFLDVVETTLSMRMAFASFDDYWAPYVGRDGPGAEYIGTLGEAEKDRLRAAVRLAYIDGEPDGPRSYVAVAWAVKGIAPPDWSWKPPDHPSCKDAHAAQLSSKKKPDERERGRLPQFTTEIHMSGPIHGILSG